MSIPNSFIYFNSLVETKQEIDRELLYKILWGFISVDITELAILGHF